MRLPGEFALSYQFWNVNGFAEQFLEEAPGYQSEFLASCKHVRRDRDAFFQQLSTIEELQVYKPAANYVFCRVPENGLSAPDVAQALYIDHNIYTKHCGGKTMPDGDRYLRIASRTPPENAALVEALRLIFGTEPAETTVVHATTERGS